MQCMGVSVPIDHAAYVLRRQYIVIVLHGVEAKQTEMNFHPLFASKYTSTK